MKISIIFIGMAGILIGAFLLVGVEITINKIRQKKRKKKKLEQEADKKASKIEFSKMILALVLSTYFLGIYIGYKTVAMDFTQLSALLAFIGAPTTTAIGFYAWKAKAENIIKIKQMHPKETEGTSIDLNSVIEE